MEHKKKSKTEQWSFWALVSVFFRILLGIQLLLLGIHEEGLINRLKGSACHPEKWRVCSVLDSSCCHCCWSAQKLKNIAGTLKVYIHHITYVKHMKTAVDPGAVYEPFPFRDYGISGSCWWWEFCFAVEQGSSYEGECTLPCLLKNQHLMYRTQGKLLGPHQDLSSQGCPTTQIQEEFQLLLPLFTCSWTHHKGTQHFHLPLPTTTHLHHPTSKWWSLANEAILHLAIIFLKIDFLQLFPLHHEEDYPLAWYLLCWHQSIVCLGRAQEMEQIFLENGCSMTSSQLFMLPSQHKHGVWRINALLHCWKDFLFHFFFFTRSWSVVLSL